MQYDWLLNTLNTIPFVFIDYGGLAFELCSLEVLSHGPVKPSSPARGAHDFFNPRSGDGKWTKRNPGGLKGGGPPRER